jgi:hypothetical protein
VEGEVAVAQASLPAHSEETTSIPKLFVQSSGISSSTLAGKDACARGLLRRLHKDRVVDRNIVLHFRQFDREDGVLD